MKISENWLREQVKVQGDTAALVHQLTMLGLEVEGVEPAGPALDGIVVGRVTSVAPHPNADRLRVCQVDVGSGSDVQIVCGATNVRAEGLYPVALPGAVLPGGMKIGRAELRGVPSAGMLCSALELGLGDAAAGKSEGLLELDPEALPGAAAARVLGLPDAMLELKITPNRADCFSVTGVARDLAAATASAHAPPRPATVPAVDDECHEVRVEAGADCPVFAVRSVRGVRPDARSPLWLRERLRRSGLRSISPVVDVTNLVMLELGQPLHAYDLDQLRGGLIVRRARQGEQLALLTGGSATLGDDFLVIADHENAVGLAGIMGGAGTAVGATTVNVLLESACFTPAVIAGRARRLGLQTDAATRFERGVDPTGQARALERATELLLAICGGRAGTIQVTGRPPEPRPPIVLRRERLRRLLGADVADPEVESVLERLDMPPVRIDGGWRVQPPAFRFDVAIEPDLIEEVARIRGYDSIPPRPGSQPTTLGDAPANLVGPDVFRAALVQRGYQEAITYSFVDRDLDRALGPGGDGLPLANPLSADLAVMRQGLWPGLVQALRHNLARQQSRVRLFEAGTRFTGGVAALREDQVLAGIVAGPVSPEQWGEKSRQADFFDVKADLEALLAAVGPASEFEWLAEAHPALQPGQSARLVRQGRHAGWLGVLHPRQRKSCGLDAAPVLFELDLAALATAAVTSCGEVSRFPAVRRDIAVIVKRPVAVSSLVQSARAAAGEALRDIVVFDIFAGGHIDASEKSVALGLILQETSRTLTDADTDAIVGGVIRRLATDFDARIRE